MQKWRVLAVVYTLGGVVSAFIAAMFINAYFVGIDTLTIDSFEAVEVAYRSGSLLAVAIVFCFVALLFLVIALYTYTSHLSVDVQHLEEKLAQKL